MRTMDLRKLRMFVRVRDFGAARRDLFPASSAAGKLFGVVAAAAEALSPQLSAQPGGRSTPREGTAAKAIARRALRQRLATIAAMARAFAGDSPGVVEKFALGRNCGDARLLVIARAFANEARPLAKLLIAHDMPSNFLTALEEEIDALAQAIGQGNAGLEKSRAMRTGIDATLEKGARAVQQLDAIVRSKLQGDDTTLAFWDSARRVDSSSRSRSGAAPPGVAAVPAPPPSPAVTPTNSTPA